MDSTHSTHSIHYLVLMNVSNVSNPLPSRYKRFIKIVKLAVDSTQSIYFLNMVYLMWFIYFEFGLLVVNHIFTCKWHESCRMSRIRCKPHIFIRSPTENTTLIGDVGSSSEFSSHTSLFTFRLLTSEAEGRASFR